MRIHNLQTYKKIRKDYKNSAMKEVDNRIDFVKKNILPKSKRIMINGVVVKEFKKAFDYSLNFLSEGKNLNDVTAFLVPSDTMNQREEYRVCDGFYEPKIRTICIRDGKSDSSQDKFCKIISQYVRSLEQEDIFVHELLHAVSHANNRKTRVFRKMEEEFVYKSTVSWFLKKGYPENRIVDDYLLPFIIYDMISNELKNVIDNFLLKNGLISSNREQAIENNMEEIVKIIVKKAREVGFSMIGKNNKNNHFDFVDELDFS